MLGRRRHHHRHRHHGGGGLLGAIVHAIATPPHHHHVTHHHVIHHTSHTSKTSDKINYSTPSLTKKEIPEIEKPIAPPPEEITQPINPNYQEKIPLFGFTENPNTNTINKTYINNPKEKIPLFGFTENQNQNQDLDQVYNSSNAEQSGTNGYYSRFRVLF